MDRGTTIERAGSATAARPWMGTALADLFFWVYTACVLGLNTVILAGSHTNVEPATKVFIASWAVLNIGVAVSFLGMRRFERKSAIVLPGFCLYVVGTSVWSAAPFTSLVYGVLLAGNALFAFTLAERLTLREFLVALQRIIVVLIVLSLIARLLSYTPVIYHDVHQRLTVLGTVPLRGFFPHKILAALYAVVGAVLTYTLVKSQIWKWSMIALAVLFTLLTGSMTGVILLPASLIVILVVQYVVKKGLRPIWGFILVAALVVVTVGLSALVTSGIFNFLGRSDTWAARVDIWRWALEGWTHRPVLGWGFHTFYQTAQSEAIRATLPGFVNYIPPHAHETYIQTLLDFGLVGLAFLLWNLGMCGKRLYAAALHNKEAIAGLAVLLVMVVTCIEMDLFYTYNAFPTFILLFLLFRCLRSSPETI